MASDRCPGLMPTNRMSRPGLIRSRSTCGLGPAFYTSRCDNLQNANDADTNPDSERRGDISRIQPRIYSADAVALQGRTVELQLRGVRERQKSRLERREESGRPAQPSLGEEGRRRLL